MYCKYTVKDLYNFLIETSVDNSGYYAINEFESLFVCRPTPRVEVCINPIGDGFHSIAGIEFAKHRMQITTYKYTEDMKECKWHYVNMDDDISEIFDPWAYCVITDVLDRYVPGNLKSVDIFGISVKRVRKTDLRTHSEKERFYLDQVERLNTETQNDVCDVGYVLKWSDKTGTKASPAFSTVDGNLVYLHSCLLPDDVVSKWQAGKGYTVTVPAALYGATANTADCLATLHITVEY